MSGLQQFIAELWENLETKAKNVSRTESEINAIYFTNTDGCKVGLQIVAENKLLISVEIFQGVQDAIEKISLDLLNANIGLMLANKPIFAYERSDERLYLLHHVDYDANTWDEHFSSSLKDMVEQASVIREGVKRGVSPFQADDETQNQSFLQMRV
ncbi:hypothetical protein [Bordetella genomosp. 13]|uniref:Uncharacterized protein n=1 Tax=Bordetella genomosp. 13 TaxID=463040 RepID=A0A1W6ZJ29_9BORD|nr:hypothetical protein [Bordetella genomosp. 13]ARP96814.1 hypothetical protein CAL15_22070 [Bordetella genomosp. 13]